METTVVVKDLTFELYIQEEQIKQRVDELGAILTERYKKQRPIFLGVLNGAFVFAADLARACKMDCEVSFIKLSSYRGLKSTGELSTRIGLELDVKDRPVIIVEDIVDSGNTLHKFIPELKRLKPASVEVVSFFLKPDALEKPIQIDYVGMEIPPAFVIGYGLDYDGYGRNLKGIYQLVEK